MENQPIPSTMRLLISTKAERQLPSHCDLKKTLLYLRRLRYEPTKSWNMITKVGQVRTAICHPYGRCEQIILKLSSRMNLVASRALSSPLPPKASRKLIRTATQVTHILVR